MLQNKKLKSIIEKSIIAIIVTVVGSVIVHLCTNKIDDRRENKKKIIQQDQQNKEPLQPETKKEENFLFIGNINDPDGYTNVRSEPIKQSTVIDKIFEGQDFKVLDFVNSWYKVESPKGIIGFMYFDRVRKKG